MADQPPRLRPQPPPQPLRLEPYNPPKKNPWGKLRAPRPLRGLDMGTATLSGLNSGAGALLGLNSGAGALRGLNSGTGAHTAASSGAGAHSLFLRNLLFWAEERKMAVGLDSGEAGELDFGAAGGLE